MRSYLTHAAIAALLLATSAGNVFAAARADHNTSVSRSDHDTDPEYLQQYSATEAQPLLNQMPANFINRTMVAPMYSPGHYDPRDWRTLFMNSPPRTGVSTPTVGVDI